MTDLLLFKVGGCLFGADAYSKSYIKKLKIGIHRYKISAKRETRSDHLNRHSHAIYNEGAKQKQEGYSDDEKAFFKHQIGIPLLCEDPEDGEEYRSYYYDRLFSGLDYEEQIARMRRSHKFYIPVTSLMTDEQMTTYIKRVLDNYAMQGIVIISPRDRQTLLYPEAQQ